MDLVGSYLNVRVTGPEIRPDVIEEAMVWKSK